MSTTKEKTSQHTAGPWHTNLASVCSADGLHITAVEGYGMTAEQNAANRRLIAAAPELKEAVEYAFHEQNTKGELTMECWDRLRSALIKSTTRNRINQAMNEWNIPASMSIAKGVPSVRLNDGETHQFSRDGLCYFTY